MPNYTASGVDPTTCGGVDGKLEFTGLTAGGSYDVTYNTTTVTKVADVSGNINVTGLSAGVYGSINIKDNTTGCSQTSANIS